MAAGLGFVSEGQLRFGAITFAGSAVVAAQMGNAIAYEGTTLADLKFIMIGYGVFAVLLLVAPLLLLIPVLRRVKKRGLFEYGALATGYTLLFDAKWVHGRPPEGETILGSSDIQSLADLNNSFAIIREMKTAPIDKSTLISLAASALLPMVPVLIFATPAELLMRSVLKLLM
jgi:hypothetical protein